MFEDKINQEMEFIQERCIKVLKEIHHFHKNNSLLKYSEISNKDLNYLISYLTELEILDEKINDISYSVNKLKKIASKNIDLLMFTKIINLQNNIRKAKKIENKFFKLKNFNENKD